MNATRSASRPREVSNRARQTSRQRIATRVRKNVTALNGKERELLRLAFYEIRNRQPDDPLSYFAIASKHYLPRARDGREKCQHHMVLFLPWHRSLLFEMESALRTVPGCESVTLPYWNVENPLPQFLRKEPFHPYVYPQNIGRSSPYRRGDSTVRYSPSDIHDEMRRARIRQGITSALSQQWFDDFRRDLESVHDSAHVAVGPTMSVPDAASFDPLFWFFHANWDRLWFRWQQKHRAMRLPDFEKRIHDQREWAAYSRADLYPMVQYTRAPQTVDMPVAYIHPKSTPNPRTAAPRGSLIPAGGFQVSNPKEVSLMVKGINRLALSGSFMIRVKAGREEVGRQWFFQPIEPKKCGTCASKGVVNITLKCPRAKLKGKLSVSVEQRDSHGKFHQIALEKVGNPTINMRTLIEPDTLIA